MKFVSTRSYHGSPTFSLKEAITQGYAPDGGMILPETIPQVSSTTLHAWSHLSFQELFVEVLDLYLSEHVPREDLQTIVHKCFSNFGHQDIIGMTELTSRKGVHLCELWHGPTCALKDLSCWFVGQLLQYLLKKDDEHTFVLVGTSGDTGSASIESVRGSENVDIVVLYPGGGRVSFVQELQMVSIDDENVHVFECDGTSDDLDIPIKGMFDDQSLNEEVNITSMNSINVGRLMAQIVHYFYCYFRMEENCEDEVSFIVPTGACGNFTAGIIAKLMGAPISTLCAAVNKNDIVYRFIERGDFSVANEVFQTHSSAIDVGVPYNVERILYLISNYNSSLVRQWMTTFEKTHSLQLDQKWVQKINNFGLRSVAVTDPDAMRCIKSVWGNDGYLMDPHTAVAVSVALSNTSPTQTHSVGCLSTAHPVKFPDAIADSLSIPRSDKKQLLKLFEENPKNHSIVSKLVQKIRMTESLKRHSSMFRKGQNWTQQLRNLITKISRKRNKRRRSKL